MTSKDELIDLEQFEVQEKFNSDENWKYFQIINSSNGKKYISKNFISSLEFLSKEILFDFSKEIYILSRLNYPSILKFAGYSLTNFKKKSKPVIVMEQSSSFTIDSVISELFKEESEFLSKWNDTKKLINIYGIASAMSYLHSHNIIHRGLNPQNIFIDDNLYPKLSGFNNSIELPQESINGIYSNTSSMRGEDLYLSPEVLSDLKYSKYSDVYAFGVVICGIMNDKSPFNYNSETENYRVEINDSVSSCYRNLIQKCWSQKPEDRPTFEEIVTELRTNQEFITETVDSDEFHKYVKFLDESKISFSEPKSYQKLDEFIEANIHQFDKSKLNFECRGASFADHDIDLSKYKFKKLYDFENDVSLLYSERIVVNKEEKKRTLEEKLQQASEEKARIMNNLYPNEVFIKSQIYSKEINDFYQHEIINFSRKLKILSQINHPSILNFIRYSSIDFDHKNKPVILIEDCPGTVSDSNKLEEYTMRLICIYGIASAMSYLHSHGIIHRNLNSSSIYIDRNGLPKLGDFDISKEIEDNLDVECNKIKGVPAFLAPEIYTNQTYSKASDVYSFGLVMYEIMTSRKPFKNLSNPIDLKREICEKGKRPSFKIPIHKAYRNLIERCWSQDPKMRPTFDEIVNELRTNKEFIIEEINEIDFYNYVKFIDEYPTSFDESKRIKLFDEAISTKLHTFNSIESQPTLNNMYETETNDLSFDYEYLNMEDFKIDKHSDLFYSTEKIFINKNTEKMYCLRKLENFTGVNSKGEVKSFINKIKMKSKLNHPAIVKYAGCFPGYSYLTPSFLIEYFKNGPLHEYLDPNQDKFPRYDRIEWDDTRRLIYFYGIAAGMAYMHSHNIIHRNLKPGKILLDDQLYPKISGFDISKEIGDKEVYIAKKIKGTPAYIAPEIYSRREYSKSSDVYSFGLIMYEVLSGEKPFKNARSPKEVKRLVCDKCIRPQIPEKISELYRNLIERCWSQEPQFRPSFESIANELRTNANFITKDINEGEFQKYIKLINESPISFDSSKKSTFIESVIKKNDIEYVQNDLKISLRSIYKTEPDNILLDYDFIDIQKYEKQKLIFTDSDIKIYKIADKQTGTLYLAKKTMDKLKYLTNFFHEIQFYFEINHPSFLKFIGYSPVDFKNKDFPILITECGQNGTLESILELDMKKTNERILNPTKQLIILYGIASAMSYMHSHNIIHSLLKPSNIYLDEFLFPRIYGFNELKYASENPIQNLNELDISVQDCQDIYQAPEYSIFSKISTASDVYSFSMIAYQIVSNELPFEEVNNDILEEICENGLRPEFGENFPECYKKLVEKCWQFDPNERPSFDEITYHLRTCHEFITENVNKEEFESYVNFLDDFQTNKNSVQFDDFIKMKTKTFRKVELDFKKIRNPTRLNFIVNMGSIDINNYQKVKKIGSGSFGNVYKVLDKETQDIYAAKISIYEIDQCSNDTIINLSREIDIISKLKHPSILQFIGFNPRNFKNKQKPIIITEYASNCSLDKIIENERLGIGNTEWDDTKKLINIYGIASGMAYLHRLNILHRDLKPANILLDDSLYPKIADFGLSKELCGEDEFEINRKHPITSGFKGTYAYCSPEIIGDFKYSKAGDVYAFGIIVYEIITNEIPFKGFNQFRLIKEVLNGYRPKFNFPIPYCYKKLIEKCWGISGEYRPSFNEIVQLLETDPNFITPNVDKDEYLDYISLLKESVPSFLLLSQSCKINNTFNGPASAPPKRNSISIKKPSVNLKIVKNEPNEKNDCFLDLSKFERQEIISKNDSSKIYKFNEVETGNIYAGQMSMFSINQISESEMDSLPNELNKISNLKHPCLLKFIGYSPIDFKKQRKPVIVTEHFSNGSLSSVLELDRINQPIQGWNSTKKLINLYGIASCMSYLHSQEIIHKSLKPNNIYLDDILTPKLGDFGLSTKFEASESITVQSISGVKATPIYSSPEVLLNNEYSKSSDVYAFGFIAYEIICNEVPFNEIANNNQIFQKVVIDQKRPTIKECIPLSYRNLIEKCWAQEASERPTFDEIVHHLKMDKGFITSSIDSDDYLKYVKFIDDQIESSEHQKVDELETIDEANNELKVTNELEKINETVPNDEAVAANETTISNETVAVSELETIDEANKELKVVNELEKINETAISNEAAAVSELETIDEANKELKVVNELEKINETVAVNELETIDEANKELKVVNELGKINETAISNEAASVNELETINEEVATNEAEANSLEIAKDAREKSVLFEEEGNDQVLTSDEFRSGEKLNESGGDAVIEPLERLASIYIDENDTGNIYKVLSALIQMGSTKLAVNYAVSLYQKKCYKQSFDYFEVLSHHNHPIAKYFIGIMKFYGLGCEESREESYKILKHLSDNSIDKATEFLQEHFQ